MAIRAAIAGYNSSRKETIDKIKLAERKKWPLLINNIAQALNSVRNINELTPYDKFSTNIKNANPTIVYELSGALFKKFVNAEGHKVLRLKINTSIQISFTISSNIVAEPRLVTVVILTANELVNNLKSNCDNDSVKGSKKRLFKAISVLRSKHKISRKLKIRTKITVLDATISSRFKSEKKKSELDPDVTYDYFNTLAEPKKVINGCEWLKSNKWFLKDE
uniref:TH1 domain-containing protein n=1 Tax=Strongyloides papillosus TaxID=174720 RepID=A0A0N5B4Z3_STREA